MEDKIPGCHRPLCCRSPVQWKNICQPDPPDSHPFPSNLSDGFGLLGCSGEADQTTHRIKPFTCGAESFRTWSWFWWSLLWWEQLGKLSNILVEIEGPERFFEVLVWPKYSSNQGLTWTFCCKEVNGTPLIWCIKVVPSQNRWSAWPLTMVRCLYFDACKHFFTRGKHQEFWKFHRGNWAHLSCSKGNEQRQGCCQRTPHLQWYKYTKKWNLNTVRIRNG